MEQCGTVFHDNFPIVNRRRFLGNPNPCYGVAWQSWMIQIKYHRVGVQMCDGVSPSCRMPYNGTGNHCRGKIRIGMRSTETYSSAICWSSGHTGCESSGCNRVRSSPGQAEPVCSGDCARQIPGPDSSRRYSERISRGLSRAWPGSCICPGILADSRCSKGYYYPHGANPLHDWSAPLLRISDSSRSLPDCPWSAADPLLPRIRYTAHHHAVCICTWRGGRRWTALQACPRRLAAGGT